MECANCGSEEISVIFVNGNKGTFRCENCGKYLIFENMSEEAINLACKKMTGEEKQ